MSNRFFIIVLVLIAGFFGAFYFIKDKNNQDSSGNTSTATVEATNHTQGEGTTGVTLVEYGDFQCPACGAFYPVVQQIKEKYGDQITFQFRHYPLNSHVNARQAHRAAEAASKQDKFWEMHDALYESQRNWSAASDPTSFFESIASNIGLDIEKFKADMQSSEVNSIINADIAAGEAVPVSATPTFVLDGQKIDNPGSVEEFYQLIDDAIAAKSDQ